MDQLHSSKLFTCRYWALGPSCPNIDQHGIEMCGYAHRDTGSLCPSTVQRGTCLMWMQNRCFQGSNCYYEHRHTGVCGLYQGVVSLTGLNLEIADAAFSSGFDTFNHEALMNLIWTVKRVILKNNRPRGAQPPPKHPVYPDRYRPSGVGDNTARKRRPLRTQSPPPFYLIRPLGSGNRDSKRKRNRGKKTTQPYKEHTGQLNRVLGVARVEKDTSRRKVNPIVKDDGGSVNNPIDLTSDTELDNEPANPNQAIVDKQRSRNDGGRHSLLSLDENENELLIDFEVDNKPNTKSETTREIISALHKVKGTLSTIRESTTLCQRTMKALFHQHDTTLGQEGIFETMKQLSKGIFQAQDAASGSITQVEQSIHWLRTDEGGVKDEIS